MRQKTTYYGRSLRWWALLVAIAAVFVSWVLAARGSLPIMEKPQLRSVNLILLYGVDGSLKSAHVTSSFAVWVLNPDGVTRDQHIRPVEFDLVRQGSQSLVLGNQLVDYSDIADDIIGISEYVWNQQHPSELSENPEPAPRRRAKRESGKQGEPKQ